MNKILRNEIEDTINLYNLYTVNNRGVKEELAPANDLEDLVDDLVQVVCDEVVDFITRDD